MAAARTEAPLNAGGRLPELEELERVIALAGSGIDVATAANVRARGGNTVPVYLVTMGHPDARAGVGYFGGVHGLERIGSQVVIAWLHSLVMRLRWDESLHALLQKVRLVFMPIVNPGGMLRGTRANPNGVDLMRNAPVDAHEPVPMLVGGQRISAGLPWYRGRRGEPMEPESAALCDSVRREMQGRAFSLALDCHSGFGMRDRIWFPFAHQRGAIAHLARQPAVQEKVYAVVKTSTTTRPRTSTARTIWARCWRKRCG